MALRIELTPRASSDVADITYRGAMEFGMAVAIDYRTSFESHIERMAAFPKSGHSVPELGQEIRRTVFRSHVIYYKADLDRLLILRVLHGSQLPQLHL